MELEKEILDLLETDEREGFISQKDHETIEQECSQFMDYVVLPALKKIQEEFRKYGYSVHISPGCFPSLYSKLRIRVPHGRTFIYWVEIKHKGPKFIIERHLSIEPDVGISQVSKGLHGRQLLGDLSHVNEEEIQRDFIEVYKRHVKINTPL